MKQEPLKILWLSHNVPYPPVRGVLMRNYNLIREVARRHKIYLVALNQKSLLPTADLVEKSRETLEQICERVYVFDLPSDRSAYSRYWYFAPAAAGKIAELVHEIPFDVVHFDTIGLCPYLSFTGEAASFLNHHNIESDMMRRRGLNERNLAKKIYFRVEAVKLRRYERKMAQEFRANLVVSELDRTRLGSIAADPTMIVIANGTDTEYFRPSGSKPVPQRLVFFGGMDWYPNRKAVLCFFDRIWQPLKRKFPEVSFTLIGRDPPASICELARNDPNIRILGFVDDIRPHVAEAEVFVCPISDGGGTRIKILDAMAMDKAIVSTTMAMEGIDARHGEHFLAADNRQEFVDGIARLFEHSSLRETIGKNARDFAERNYSWRAIGQALSDSYRLHARARR